MESVSLRLRREFQGNREFLFKNCCLTSALKGTEDNACGNTQASTLSQEVIQESWTLWNNLWITSLFHLYFLFYTCTVLTKNLCLKILIGLSIRIKLKFCILKHFVTNYFAAFYFLAIRKGSCSQWSLSSQESVRFTRHDVFTYVQWVWTKARCTPRAAAAISNS